MSSSMGAVKFKDGLIKYYIYHGTSDICFARLFDTIIESEKVYFDTECNCNKDEEVEIMDTYGGGKYWKGKACRFCDRITEGRAPYGDELTGKGRVEYKDGEPEWSPFKED